MSTAEGRVQLWDPRSGDWETELEVGEGRRSCAARRPGGGWLAHTSDAGEGQLVVCDPSEGGERIAVPLPEPRVRTVRWLPTGERLLVLTQRKLLVCKFDGESLQVETQTDFHPVAFGWSPDGHRLALTTWSFGESACVWDVRTAFEARAPRGVPGDAAWAVAWSSDGRWLASCHNDGRIHAWRESEVVGRPREPDLDLARDPGVAAHTLAFQPGTQTLAVAVGAEVWRFDVDDGGREVVGSLKGLCANVRHLSYAPDGERFAVGCEDGAVRLWDPSGARPLVRLPGYHDAVAGLQWAHEGRRLLSWSGGAKARVHIVAADEVVAAAGAASSANELTEAEWTEWMADAGARRPTWPY